MTVLRPLLLSVPLRVALVLCAGLTLLAARGTALLEEGEPESPLDAWWAYAPLREQAPPATPDARWSAHPVDAWVQAARAERGLESAEHASPEVILRRATFDLTGLPPTPGERRAFLADERALGFEEAWSILVERLLASPQHAEHFARRWLDLVRYGETNGYERDAPKRNVWRYRDWVVRAFERDLPYDAFATAQLAGDELADRLDDRAARAEALLATGFHRVGLWDDEPADPEQARADELADIVDTTSQVFMGSTLGCARCHDHKADPFTQREYYAFTAHFAGLVGYGGGGFGQHLGAGATRDVPRPDGGALPTQSERDAQLARIDAELSALFGATPGRSAGEVLVADARAGEQAWRWRTGEPLEGWSTVAFDASAWDASTGGFGTAGTPGASIGTVWDTSRIQLRTSFRLEAIPESLLLELHHDEDVAVFLNGQLVLERSGYRVDYGQVQLPRAALDALVVGRNVLAVDCRQTGGGQYIDVGLSTGFDPAADDARSVFVASALRGLEGVDAARARTLQAERAALAASPVAEPFPAQVAFEHGSTPPAQFVHLRGSVHAPGEEVGPSVPAAWMAGSASGTDAPYLVPTPDQQATSSGRRLALARWLFTGGAHLAARVEANRLWQALFDRGLCATPGDFGRLGLAPTHPELLDHLANVLIESGWSRRAVLRHLLTSETYRMASAGPDASLAADPRNLWLWRQNPRRLTAEEYRDATLAVSGELDRATYGPSVFPPLPPEVLATSSRPDAAWGPASEAAAHRRSLYVHVKRSLREPLLAALDQPDPDLPCPERFPTNVPTQALLTLNGEHVHARAAALALDLSSEPDPRARVRTALERAYAREADEREVDAELAFVARLTGELGVDEQRAWSLFALGLFNRNEFLWLD